MQILGEQGRSELEALERILALRSSFSDPILPPSDNYRAGDLRLYLEVAAIEDEDAI